MQWFDGITFLELLQFRVLLSSQAGPQCARDHGGAGLALAGARAPGTPLDTDGCLPPLRPGRLATGSPTATKDATCRFALGCHTPPQRWPRRAWRMPRSACPGDRSRHTVRNDNSSAFRYLHEFTDKIRGIRVLLVRKFTISPCSAHLSAASPLPLGRARASFLSEF